MIVVVQNGWLSMLDSWVASGKLARIRLYQNDYTPTPTDVASYYVQATFSGYPGFTALSWGLAFVNGANQGEIDATAILWAHNGGPTANTIFGIYVTDEHDVLTYAERFAAPIRMAVVTDSQTYTPKVTVVDQ